MGDEDVELYVARLQESLGQVKYLSQRSIHDPVFRRWRNRTQRSLDQLFGAEHDYSTSFRELEFCAGWESDDPEDWSVDDQERFNESVVEAGHIVQDAHQEGLHRLRNLSMPVASRVIGQKAAKSVAADAVVPPIQVTIYNTLSNVTVLSQSQVLNLVEQLDIDDGRKGELKRLAGEFQREATGKKRWAALGKCLEGMKGLGKAAYEKVALPLLLAYIKKELGMGDP